MRTSNVDRGSGPDGPGRSDDESDPVPQPASPSPQQQNVAGPLIGLSRDEPRPPAGLPRTGSLPSEDPLPKSDAPKPSVNAPFIVDYKTRSITKFGQPCLVERHGKLVPMRPMEFDAAALLIEHMGQYVPIVKLCSHLQCDAAGLQAIIARVRQILGLGHRQSQRNSLLVLMPDGRPARGYGMFIAPSHYAANASPRGTIEALLSDLEAEAGLTVLSADDSMLVVRIEDQTARLHIGSIKGRAPAQFHLRAVPESSPPEDESEVHDVMVGWDSIRAVYGLKRLGRPTFIGNPLLGEAQASGLAYHLDSAADVENGIFTVESTFAAQPENLTTALTQYLEHQRSQAEGIPSTVTTQQDAQAVILGRLGATRHGLLGVNPLPVYDLPAPLPPRALLYVNRIAPHGSRGALGIRPMLAGRKQGLPTSFYQREGIATLVLGLHEHDGTTLVVAWDPDGRPTIKGTVLSVDGETLRVAEQIDDVVSQSRQKLTMGRSEEVLAAPLEHLDELIVARLRTPPRQRMIDALGGSSCVTEHLNMHAWTMVIDERLVHVQWCGPLLRGDAPPHIRPFSIADRFVAPDPDAVVLYAGHDPRNDVVVLWRQAAGESMHEDMVFSVPDSIIDAAVRTGMATHVTHIGSKQLVRRDAVAARYEADPLTSALNYLAREQDHRQIWRSRSTNIHERLFEHLQPVEWSDWERTRTRPWPITIELPELGTQSLDVFAYRAQTSETRLGFIAITIRPFIPSSGGRTSLFAAGREPVLLGEWDGIYVLFDPRVRPTVKQATAILITISRDQLEAVRKRGLARMTRQHRYGEFEEAIIFATGERLLEAFDLRLKTPPRANLKRIRESLDMNDPQALAEMAARLHHALRLPDRHALTGTRDVPDKMVVVTGPPKGVEVVVVENEIRRALQAKLTTDDARLLWMHSPETGRAVLLHAGLRAVLQTGEAPRWPAPEQFDVLWALMQAAIHEETVSHEIVQAACRNSLQWLFVGPRALFELGQDEVPGAYQVRSRHAVAAAGHSIDLPKNMLALAVNHASLFAPPKARPDIVWTFIKNVGRTHILPKGSIDDVVFELNGQRTWVYGLTKTLHRSEDAQTDYVTPALSPAQLSRIRSNPNDQHVLAAFDPEQGNYVWVLWSARAHFDRLHDPSYRLHVGADLSRNATQEWRKLEGGRVERVVIYRASRSGIPTVLKRLSLEPPSESVSPLEALAAEGGLTLEQVLGAMKPRHQLAVAMHYGLAPYDRRRSAAEIRYIMGYDAMPTGAEFRRAANFARAYLEAGEPLPELTAIIGLLRDPRAEQFMGSSILLTMLWDLYGLEPGAEPAPLARVFGARGFSGRVWHALYRELIMRLIRGANEHGVATTAHFDIGATVRGSALPGAAQIEIEADPAMPPQTQAAAADDPTPEERQGAVRDRLAAAIALPTDEQLEASYASAAAVLQQERETTWPSDVALPVALVKLPPDVELIMRAYLGVWPYPHRYTVEQVTAAFDIDTPARSQLLIRLASNELLAHAESLSGIVLPAKNARPTLERLATLLTNRADVLTDDELDAVLTRHGLATVEPLVTEATRQGVLGEFRLSLQYRQAVRKLTGEAAKTEKTNEDGPYWQPELIDEVYKRIDAGEYARLLLLLRDPETRDETFADMVLGNVVAVNHRASHRSSAMRGKRMYVPKRGHTSLAYEESVTRNFGFDPSIDTFWQRANELDAVLDHALTITDEDAQWLQRIADDGRLAFDEFLTSNLKLAYAAAIRVGYADYREESSAIFDDAISGLQRAVWGYNPKMSFSFANYAVPVLRARIFRLSAVRYARQFGVSIYRAEEILMTRAARAQLREQTAEREPTLEELARAVLQPLLRVRLVEQLKAEPTATQLQAGWHKYMPEFLRRLQENLAFINAYRHVTSATSMDRNLIESGHGNLYDIVGSSQQLAPPISGDEPDGPALADDLGAALRRAGLSEREQFVLQHHFGVTGYTRLSTEEIAARHGISEEAVQDAIASAVGKIRQSWEAQMLLMPYLQQERNTGL